ncbi:dienelactone hydrolase family protein [Luteolibacter pohnpeiensis]|uniref:Dienelactone hydrolase family protein n=1 Tax=Luteolibacter pohnpeiensis TaxID=454153 RepID=A0A934S8Z8_9BACT|nr:dienelactone hydrolase family protein [Luteolibacter pohnpeiensis]MBK1883051.1 dienelactone hydrolase family protein [Luteolibacter pohnpeiensis]
MKTPLLALVSLLSLPFAAQAKLIEKTVDYEQGGQTLEGFHVYDDATTGKRPGILIIHQWTGLTDYEKGRARQLAEMGYNVFAADIYGKGIRPQVPEAAKVSGKYKADRKLYRERLDAGLQQLKSDNLTDPSRIAAIGYCFGGGGVLELARSGADIAGVVSFHGDLSSDPDYRAKKDGVHTKVLVLQGADDPYAPEEQVKAFQKEFSEAGADWQFISYSGTVHSFTQKMAGNDPSKGAAYHEASDRRSWQAMKDFFAEIFAGK